VLRKSLVVDSRNVETAQNKHVCDIKGRVNARLPSWRRRNLDDTLPTLLGWWDTLAGTHRAQSSQGKFEQIHLDWQGFVQTRVYSPYPDICKWWAVHAHYGITSRRDMRESHWWSSSLIEGHSRWILLANHEGRLYEVCTAMQIVPTTCWLAQGTPRRVEIDS